MQRTGQDLQRCKENESRLAYVLNNTEKELNLFRDVIEGKTKETIELSMTLKRSQNDNEE